MLKPTLTSLRLGAKHPLDGPHSSDRGHWELNRSMATRWGVAGTGRIASDFVRDLSNVPEATVVAVGSRTLAGAREFSAKFDIPTAVASVEALAALDDVDVVYVAGIHPVHHDHAVAMMRAGKHVLVEKPIAMNVAQASSMVATSRETNRFLMEAMWMRFNPLHVALKQRLDAGEFGHCSTSAFIHSPSRGGYLAPRRSGTRPAR